MLRRVIVIALFVCGASAAVAISYTFRTRISGRLQGPVLFEFYREGTTRPKTDIVSLCVSVRTPDDLWKPVWLIDGGHRVTQPIEYGVTPAGFNTLVAPQKLRPDRTYMAGAVGRGGGHSSPYFRFRKDGKIMFPNSPD